MNRPGALKTYLLVFCLFCTASVSFGQDATIDDGKPDWSCRDTTKFTSTGLIGINAGIEPPNGFALIGALPLKNSHFGFAAKLGYGQELYYSEQVRPRDYYFLVGGYMTFQLNTHYAFDLRALGGIMYCSFPALTYTNNSYYSYVNGNYSTDSVVYSNVTVHGINAFSIAFQGGIGFRYMIARNLGLQLNVDYSFRAPVLQQISSTLSYSDVSTYNSGNNTTTNASYSLPATTINTTINRQDRSGFAIISFGVFYQVGTAVLKQ